MPGAASDLRLLRRDLPPGRARPRRRRAGRRRGAGDAVAAQRRARAARSLRLGRRLRDDLAGVELEARGSSQPGAQPLRRAGPSNIRVQASPVRRGTHKTLRFTPLDDLGVAPHDTRAGRGSTADEVLEGSGANIDVRRPLGRDGRRSNTLLFFSRYLSSWRRAARRSSSRSSAGLGEPPEYSITVEGGGRLPIRVSHRSRNGQARVVTDGDLLHGTVQRRGSGSTQLVADARERDDGRGPNSRQTRRIR